MDAHDEKPSSLTQQFDYDLFISYSWEDDLPYEEGARGVVSEFRRLIDVYKGGYYRRPLRIFKDDKLPGNASLHAILPAVKKSALFIAFLSPRYVDITRNPNWCQLEAEAFYEHARQTIGERIGDKWRVFRILIFPVELDRQQPFYFRQLVNQKDYELFERNDTGKLIHLRKEFGGEIKERFLRRVMAVTTDIVDMLTLMESQIDSNPRKAIVYLAQTTSDLEREYDSLRHELKRRGYKVLPECDLPKTFNLVEEEVHQCLKRAMLSIQLIGNLYGQIPEETEKSIPVLQNELIAAHCQATQEFLRLIWMPPNLNLKNSKQKQFVQSLRGSFNDCSREIDLNQTPFEDFKFFVIKKLEVLNKPTTTERNFQAPGTAEPTIKYVYLLYDRLDREQVSKVKRHLHDTSGNLEVLEPTVDIDESTSSTDLRKQHEDTLKLCDAVLIYWGHSRKSWLQTKQIELIKISNIRSKAPLAKAIYLGEPLTSEKSEHRSREFDIIQGLDDAFDRFLAQISGEQGLPPC